MNFINAISKKINQKNERTTAVWQYGGFSAFFETFVLVESSGIFSNFGAESPPHRQAAKRCVQAVRTNWCFK